MGAIGWLKNPFSKNSFNNHGSNTKQVNGIIIFYAESGPIVNCHFSHNLHKLGQSPFSRVQAWDKADFLISAGWLLTSRLWPGNTTCRWGTAFITSWQSYSPNSSTRFWWQDEQKWRRLHENA